MPTSIIGVLRNTYILRPTEAGAAP
jgi:hypothetical protein